jgi:hypothetical protein
MVHGQCHGMLRLRLISLCPRDSTDSDYFRDRIAEHGKPASKYPKPRGANHPSANGLTDFGIQKSLCQSKAKLASP